MAAPTAVRRLSTVQLARVYYRAQTSVSRATANRVQALWRELDRRDLTGSWQALVGPQIIDTVTAGQYAAAARADGYVSSAAAAEGASGGTGSALDPGAFAGHASDGRPLDSLLYMPVITMKTRIAGGVSEVDALLAGLQQLLKMTVTQVADAGRTATGAAIAGRRTIQGYIRVASAPCCARCAILSGKEYGWNAGFQRHPRCDCYHVPAALIARSRGPRRGGTPGLPSNAVTDARAYFRSLSRAEQDRIFTRAGAQAIRDGADINAIVNARRGMYTASALGRRIRATREATTRRGLFFQREFRRLQQQGLVPPGVSSRGYRLRAPRLMPEEIYALASDRDEAIRLLYRFGYLV